MSRTPFKSKSLCCLATVLFSIFTLFGSASAETFTVNKTADTNDGVCNGFDCSLREAIAAANTAPTNDIIEFSPFLFSSPQQINLLGDGLNIANNGTLQINGIGIDPSRITISGSNSYRIFFINPGALVAIRRMTIRDGRGWGQNFLRSGGAVYNSAAANTLLENMVVTNNSVASPDGGIALYGGAVYNAGTMTIRRSRIENNSVPESPLPETSVGGGIYNAFQATLNLTESSVTNNTVGGNGGGISNASQATLNIINSTISGNSATGDRGVGGGLINVGTVNATHATIAKNTASISFGGVSTFDGSGTFNSRNSIYADNTADANNRDFYGTMVSGGYNLIESTTETIITGDTSGNILNQDPMLRPLAANEYEPSLSHIPAPRSPVVDKGSSFNFYTDQRGYSKPVDIAAIANAPGGNGADIGAVELRGSEIPNQAPFDFDGDRKSDIGVYRPSTGYWWISISSAPGLGGGTFGTATDKPVMADYTGDKRVDMAFFRPSDATWHILRSETSYSYTFQFGESNDIPAPGDFDGDGKVDPAVYRPSTGQWFIQRSSDNVVVNQYFGIAKDKPAVADYDGDGKADIAIFRPSTGAWWINQSSAGIIAIQFGDANDKIVQGDYTGDGKADLALWRESNGYWYILRSEDYSFYGFPFGTTGDKPVPGDYDGDGKLDAGIFRPSDNGWYLLNSTQGISIRQFGTSGDIPLPNIFVR